MVDDISQLVTFRQYSQSQPIFSEASLRERYRKREALGLSDAFVKIGGRVYINQPVFNRLIQQPRG